MKRHHGRECLALCLTLAVLAALACGEPIEIITTCEPAAGITPICGVQNPEDLVALPGGEWVLFGEFRGLGRTFPGPGGIGALRVSDNSIFRIYPVGSGTPEADAAAGWGSPECPGPPQPDEFNPAGMDIIPVGPATAKLLVVNVGGPESVEFFAVDESGEVPRATWRGCVRMPEGVQGNNVAGLPQGGFVVSTAPAELGTVGQVVAYAKFLLAMEQGAILEWTPEGRWSEIPGTQAATPNGILVSLDGRTVYYASPSANEVIRVNRVGDPLRQTTSVAGPDNLTWTKDGRILAASIRGLSLYRMMRDCSGLLSGACGTEFAVVAIDPSTFEATDLIVHQGPPIGLVTAALEVGDRIFLGTAMGDRMAYINRADLGRQP
jgi:hypothetical protein